MLSGHTRGAKKLFRPPELRFTDRGPAMGLLSQVEPPKAGFSRRHFTEFAHPAGVPTQPGDVNWFEDIVGSFEDTSRKAHRFLLAKVLATQIWTQIDDPSSNGETVVK
jgi:hypothetical protein